MSIKFPLTVVQDASERWPAGLPAYGVAEDVPTDTTILAFDPGGTTGWCRATYSPATGKIYNQKFGQITGTAHHRGIGALIEENLFEFPHLMVVTEDYRPEFGQAQKYVALEYIGTMRYVCQRQMISFERQNRDAKEFWTSDKLRKAGFWAKSMEHARDAARHWLAYASKQNRHVQIHLSELTR